ncbi:hypothetical protein WJX75_005340 [Coccomyxa subellipsoidea]|uniref:Uncharacterized protein n=1 Tax=Coccomyxa subellipsoidea TaxID=248742 RepID=A0ABR2YAM6_9CHLO
MTKTSRHSRETTLVLPATWSTSGLPPIACSSRCRTRAELKILSICIGFKNFRRSLAKACALRANDANQKAIDSLSETLKSSARVAGPKVVRGESKAAQKPPSGPAFTFTRSGFIRAMSDAGLKPTVVHHNLTHAELYEQALQYEGRHSHCGQRRPGNPVRRKDRAEPPTALPTMRWTRRRSS